MLINAPTLCYGFSAYTGKGNSGSASACKYVLVKKGICFFYTIKNRKHAICAGTFGSPGSVGF